MFQNKLKNKIFEYSKFFIENSLKVLNSKNNNNNIHQNLQKKNL